MIGRLDNVGRWSNSIPMGRDDWYRNTDWDADTEAAFRAKLSRSRSMRPQYLQIQASCLANHRPMVALELIEEYFETGDEFVVPNAFCTRAEAYRALGEVEEAVAAYKRALEWEENRPGFLSTARYDLPRLVAELNLSSEYDYALDILATRFGPTDHLMPSVRYQWNGSAAIISNALGNRAEAQEFAERALRAAAQTESPFRYHRSFGLVRNATDEFGIRVKRIARPSKLRSLLGVIRGT